MNMQPALTIAVPAYNMGWCLEKNLRTYCDDGLAGRLEVVILNNASTDETERIARRFCREYPGIFRLCSRESRGYGGSVNQALSIAKGRYFRIVDADDWVDTRALERLVKRLANCAVDIVQTDYTIVDMQSGRKTPVNAGSRGIRYGTVYRDFACAVKTLPMIHSTAYRTELLREAGFSMQDDTFFVDEEYTVLPFLRAETIVYFPENVYQYQVANPEQSTSPRNRGVYAAHRERVVRRLIAAYRAAARSGRRFPQNALPYCLKRIQDSAADHFTTLYIYVEDRAQGRRMAARWADELDGSGLSFRCGKKRAALSALNALRVSPVQYAALKKVCFSVLGGWKGK